MGQHHSTVMGEVIAKLTAHISLKHHSSTLCVVLLWWGERLDSLASVYMRHFDQTIQVSAGCLNRDVRPHAVLHFEIIRRGCLRRTHVLQVVQVVILSRVA